jgi:sulfotransferase family protein
MPEAISLRPPVIIIGAHRSGTTATARALRLLGLQTGDRLDSHDEPRELQRLHENYLRRVGAAWYDPNPFLASIASHQGKQDCITYLCENFRSDLSVLGYQKGIRGWWLRRRLRSGVPWGWKEPRTTLFASCWVDLFPDARFLHVVRNPVAVATSIQRREREFQAKGDPPSGHIDDFEYCLELAMIYVAAGEALQASGSTYLRVRFEDIQSNPLAELGKMAAFCQLHFNDWQMQRAASTIRPTRADTLQQVSEKRDLLARYPLALRLGYDGDEGVPTKHAKQG